MDDLPFKLIIFDLNKTLIQENSWYDLNLALGVSHQEDQQLLNEYLNGKLSYQNWMAKLLRLYKERGRNTSLQNISSILHNYKYVEGAQETIKYLKEKKYPIAIISGAMDILVEHVARDLGIETDMAMANNVFIFSENGKELSKIKTLGDDLEAKVEMLMTLCSRLGIDPTQCVCIGDGDNDAELFKKTAHGITFANSQIRNTAWKTIEKLSDLKEIF